MLELRQELSVLIQWDESAFEYREQAELDAIGHRIMRMAELISKIRELAERN